MYTSPILEYFVLFRTGSGNLTEAAFFSSFLAPCKEWNPFYKVGLYPSLSCPAIYHQLVNVFGTICVEKELGAYLVFPLA